MEKYALAGFSKFNTVPACVKSDLVLILLVINFSWFLHNNFVELDKMQVNIEESNTIFDELNKLTPGCIKTKIPSV